MPKINKLYYGTRILYYTRSSKGYLIEIRPVVFECGIDRSIEAPRVRSATIGSRLGRHQREIAHLPAWARSECKIRKYTIADRTQMAEPPLIKYVLIDPYTLATGGQ